MKVAPSRRPPLAPAVVARTHTHAHMRTLGCILRMRSYVCMHCYVHTYVHTHMYHVVHI
jgi:hypothetical protein